MTRSSFSLNEEYVLMCMDTAISSRESFDEQCCTSANHFVGVFSCLSRLVTPIVIRAQDDASPQKLDSFYGHRQDDELTSRRLL
jgi:hypothetical protein